MSVNYYYGAYASSPELSDYVVRLREAVSLIVAHTPAAVDTVVSNTASAYDVILHIGTDRYAEIGIAVDGDTATGTVSIGRKASGQYYATETSSTSNLTVVSTAWKCSLIVVNGGDAWELAFNPVSNGSLRMRFVKLRSGIDGMLYWTGYKYAGDNISTLFPDSRSTGDKFLIGDTEYVVRSEYVDAGNDNVPSGTMLLFPTCIYAQRLNTLGFPTIGNQIPYSMSARAELGIEKYSEFLVARQRFVSLGNIAVRSI